MTKTATEVLTPEHTNIGLDEGKRAAIVESLNRVLADEHVLYIKTRNYHWNVRGPRFNDLHKFFEAQYEALSDIIDQVAENARQFGGFAHATMAEFSKNSHLKEHPGDFPDSTTMVRNLLADQESVIVQLRKDVAAATDMDAADAADFLTGVLEKHNQMAWMLRSFTAPER